MNSPANPSPGILSLRKQVLPMVDTYASDDYEGIAFHSSSIMIYANKAVADMFGYTEEEIVGMNAWLLFKTESVEKIMKHLIDKSEEPYSVKAVRKDRSIFDVELKGKDFMVSGEPVRAVLVRKL